MQMHTFNAGEMAGKPPRYVRETSIDLATARKAQRLRIDNEVAWSFHLIVILATLLSYNTTVRIQTV